MPITYTCDPERALVISRSEGAVNAADVLEYFNQLAADESCPVDPIEVADLTGVEDFVFAYSDASDFTPVFMRAKETRNLKGTIFICNSQLSFGFARMFESLLGLREPPHPVRTAGSMDEVDGILADMRKS